MDWEKLLEQIKAIIREFTPFLAVLFYNYEESRIDASKHETLDLQVKLQEGKNHEAIENKYANGSDLDVINDVLKGGNGQSGKGDQ